MLDECTLAWIESLSDQPNMRKDSKNTIYTDTTIPRVLDRAISVRYRGATTVRPPAPRPENSRENSSKPKIPDEKVVIKKPVIQIAIKICHVRRRPSLSVMPKARMAPNAAPRTPNDVILAFVATSSLFLPSHCLPKRPRSYRKDGMSATAAKPPSS